MTCDMVSWQQSPVLLQSTAVEAVSTLILSNLAREDEGEYFCTARYTEFPTHSIYNASLYIRGGYKLGLLHSVKHSIRHKEGAHSAIQTHT